MKVAITVWGNRISPVFDSAQTIMLAEVLDGSVHEQDREFVADSSGAGLAHALIEKEIDTLICGAISERPALIIQQSGIALLSFVGGNAERFLEDYAAGRPLELFRMPGCHKHKLDPGISDERLSEEEAILS